MAKKKFVRKDCWSILRLGRRKKKLRKWRRAKGRHSKIREKRRSYLAAPEIGYRSKAATRGIVSGVRPKSVRSIGEMNAMKHGEAAIIGKMGKRKKMEIARIAEEKKVRILNLDTGKFLRRMEIERKEREERKKKTELEKKEKKAEKGKKAEEKKEEEKSEKSREEIAKAEEKK